MCQTRLTSVLKYLWYKVQVRWAIISYYDIHGQVILTTKGRVLSVMLESMPYCSC